jgi:hypothetical protein
MMFAKCTPIIPVADLVDAGAWFARCLGFVATPVGDTMVHLARDEVNIRLVQKADDMDMADPRRQQSIYIDVVDIDAFYATHGPALEEDGNSRPPFDRTYGMREVHVIYESLLMFFGTPIKKVQI